MAKASIEGCSDARPIARAHALLLAEGVEPLVGPSSMLKFRRDHHAHSLEKRFQGFAARSFVGAILLP